MCLVVYLWHVLRLPVNDVVLVVEGVMLGTKHPAPAILSGESEFLEE